jgi:histidinol-phosphatase (PHP family)
MLYDTHVHTDMSADSDMRVTVALAAAHKLGIGLITTEHVDFECDSDLAFVTDVPLYLETYSAYKPEGLLTGLEVGLTVESFDQNQAVTADPRLDYIIGSIHVVEGHDIFTSFYAQELPPPELYRQYLRYAAAMIELYDNFDSLGHIDYPSRYSPFAEKNIVYQDFQHEYNTIFDRLIEKDKALEINTARFSHPAAQANWYSVCEAFYKRGGRDVTVGSDAHDAGQIGRGLQQAYQMAYAIGLSPVYYRARRRTVVS